MIHIRLNADIHQSLDYCPHVITASVLKRIVRDAAFLVGSERVPVGELLYRRAAVHSVSHIRKVVFVHFGNDGAPYHDYEKPDCIHMQYALEPRKANAAQERCGLQLSSSKV